MEEVDFQSMRELLDSIETKANEAGRKDGMEVAASFCELYAANLRKEGDFKQGQFCDAMANRIRALVRAGKIYK